MRSRVKTSDLIKMIDNIKKALERLINRSEWMDGQTKKRAIEKSNMIGSMVGFSETMTDLVCGMKFLTTIIEDCYYEPECTFNVYSDYELWCRFAV